MPERPTNPPRPHRLKFGRFATRLRHWIVNFYETEITKAVIELLAVVVGFTIATAWEARKDDLSERIALVTVLDFLSDEVPVLAARIEELDKKSQTGPCQIELFETPNWDKIRENGQVRALRDLYSTVRQVYTDLATLSSAKKDARVCRKLLHEVHRELATLSETMKTRTEEEERRIVALSLSVKAGARATFIATWTAVSVAAVLFLPAVVSWFSARVAQWLR